MKTIPDRLHLRSACSNVAQMDQVDLIVVIKEEDIKEEPCDYVIALCQNEEEKPSADICCKTETDLVDSNVIVYNTATDTETNADSNEVQKTEVKIEVKKEEDEEDLASLLILSKSLLLF